MKVLITGAKGLLGSELAAGFKSRGHEVAALDHDELDVTKPETIAAVLNRHTPDVIINCAVIVNVDRCEADPERAYAVNRDGAMNVMAEAAALTTPPIFVQVSSSEVFGGWNGGYKIEGYREDDERHPDSVYQKSKKEAEDLVRAFGETNPEKFRRWYITRASWLYGKGRETFVEQFARALQDRGELVVAHDQWRSPTWTQDFAEALHALIASDCSSGIYHIVNEVKPGEATVMDVIEEIRQRLGISRDDVRMERVALREFFKIPRAPSNVLLNTKLPKLRPWREALRDYLRERYPESARS